MFGSLYKRVYKKGLGIVIRSTRLSKNQTKNTNSFNSEVYPRTLKFT